MQPNYWSYNGYYNYTPNFNMNFGMDSCYGYNNYKWMPQFNFGGFDNNYFNYMPQLNFGGFGNNCFNSMPFYAGGANGFNMDWSNIFKTSSATSPSESGSATSATTSDTDATDEIAETVMPTQTLHAENENNTKTSGKKSKLTKSERKMLDDNSKKTAAEEKSNESGSLGASLAFGSLFVSKPILEGAGSINKNLPATEIFFELNTATQEAKYAELFKKAPTVMEEAQEAMAKASRKYKRDLRRAAGNPAEIKKINEEFDILKKMMVKSLESGNPERVAKTTARLNGANKIRNTKFRKAWRKLNGKDAITSRVKTAGKVDTSKVKTVLGNKFFKNFGGKAGLILGTLMTAAMLFCSKDKIKEAYSYDKKTGNKQLWQSITEAAVPSLFSYTVGDAIGRTAKKALLKKFASKIAVKVASKGACKVLGATIGSVVPGLGTVAGMLIGTVLDFALSKWVIPAVFGKNDVVKVAEINHRNDEDRMQELCIKEMEGSDLSEEEEKVIKSHPELYAKASQSIQEICIKKYMKQDLTAKEQKFVNAHPDTCSMIAEQLVIQQQNMQLTA